MQKNPKGRGLRQSLVRLSVCVPIDALMLMAVAILSVRYPFYSVW